MDALFPDASDIDARTAAVHQNLEGAVRQEGRELACASPDALAEIVLEKAKEAFRMGDAHPGVSVRYNRDELKKWLHGHGRRTAEENSLLGVMSTDTELCRALRDAVCKHIDRTMVDAVVEEVYGRAFYVRFYTHI